MARVERYVLPSARILVQERRHWAVMLSKWLKAGGTWLALLAIAVWAKSSFVYSVAMFFLLFAGGWLLWVFFDWWREQFAVTNRRILLLRGIFVNNLGIMPLGKVTDLTYERDPLGQLLGYGTFIIESAGQDQALSRIDYVSHPDYWYRQMTTELFGQSVASDVRIVDVHDDAVQHVVDWIEPEYARRVGLRRPPWRTGQTEQLPSVPLGQDDD